MMRSSGSRDRAMRWLRLLLPASAAVAGLVAYVLLREMPAPPPSQSETPADAIVVLGGRTPQRVQMAVTLYQNGVAPVVVVSGDNDTIVAALAGRIPATAIQHENAATSTFENARFTEPFLRKLGAKDVVIVSSWYHVRRAQRIFEHRMPDIRFRVAYLPEPAFPQAWEKAMSRRERFAVWHTTLMHGVWCL
jgi:uncharacterized SAM-binding protein YcdF (DUF218 family)